MLEVPVLDSCGGGGLMSFFQLGLQIVVFRSDENYGCIVLQYIMDHYVVKFTFQVGS